MSQVMLDTELRNRLGDLSRIQDLCDENGRVVARIIPQTSRYWIPPFTKEELDKIANETEWFSSEEVFDMLKKLEETQ